MASSLQSGMSYFADKAGDCLIYMLDEVKFWGEVFVAFMEWDEEGAERWAQEQRAAMKEQMQDMKQQ
eukprot:CAMPEP_0116881378 /NCGR_PEP_ID=MMETSP0463-20121206/13495_1 /TAXON_ID=181622 /ORGANISM="Strombidinopsis sp, Strain SopsisLIS2011" /LENGTH=66 /DNA_ID=CAMNT_0004533273 /DNA_START=11 /DNA_END=211 /DNA_ORIENTATION=-